LTNFPFYDILYFVDYISQQKVKSMKLSTRGEYGTLALLDLALHRGEKPVPLKDVAQRQGIPLQYLEHLITPLIAAGIVRSIRGARGGVWLARPPQEVRLSEVIQLLEGSIAPVECVNSPETCHRSALCVTHDIWGQVKEAINKVLESTTLQDLVERQKQKGRVIKR